ncbi:uncharacterized protein BDW70DRAFT_114288 [Aspergillus foveolatus]|uniref:uncharacterized protein n=1 Tax=Aspergillus foveolatus TaxID=210207 RepID=UPI003CCCB76B
MSRSGASKHPGSRLARLIIAGHAVSSYAPYAPYAPYASYAPIRSVCCVCSWMLSCARGGHACTWCFQNGTSGNCRLYRVYWLSCFLLPTSLLHAKLASRAKHAGREKLLGIAASASQISRLWVSTMDGHIGFRLPGPLGEGAGTVSSRSVLGQSGNTRSSRICAKVELCSYYAFACRG